MSILIRLVTEFFFTKLVFDCARGLWALEYEIPKPIAVPSARLGIISTFFFYFRDFADMTWKQDK